MKKILIVAILTVSVGFSVGCSHKMTAYQRDVLRQVATHKLEPTEAFISTDSLYLRYVVDDTSFLFEGNLDAVESKEKEKTISLSAKENFSPKKKQSVEIASFELLDIVTPVLKSLLPNEPSSGIAVMVGMYEIMIYRQADGSSNWSSLDEVPDDIRIVGKVSSKQFGKLFEQQLKSMRKNSTQTKFLIKLEEEADLFPFLYVDISTSTFALLELPSYYQFKKEMSSLGFSSAIIYSFGVKSHLWGTIKAPFTTSHRLVGMGLSSAYALFPTRLANLNTIPPLTENPTDMDIDDFNKWLNKHINKQIYKARLKLLIDGEEFFPHWMLAMQRAKKSIFTTVYIFISDPYGLYIADTMKKRAAQGVDVRITLDELNTILNSKNNLDIKPSEDFVMPKSMPKYLRKGSSVKVRTHLNPWGTFDHSKVYIIDNKLAYTGGMNIGEEYRYAWHDMMVALEGPVVDKLVKNYYTNWSFTGWGGDFAAAYRHLFTKNHREFNEATPDMVDVRLMYTKPSSAQIKRAQLEAIKRARHRIFIQNAYFSDDDVVSALISARARGVDVRVIFPGKNNHAIMGKNNQYVANKLFQNGIRVYFYNGMTHVKAAVYDGWAVVGSANFDKMSLYINKEMSLGISDPTFVNELVERLFEKDFTKSDEMQKLMSLSWAHVLASRLTNQL